MTTETINTKNDLLKVFNDAVEAHTQKLDTRVASLDDVIARYGKKEEAKPPEVKLESGAVAGLTKMEFFNVPLGKIAIGTFGGVFFSEVIDGFLAKQSEMVKGGVKLVGAGVVAGWGSKWLGKDAATVIALVLGVFGLSQILPVDKWAKQLAGGVSKFLPGTVSVTGMEKTRNPLPVRSENYYAAAFGRN